MTFGWNCQVGEVARWEIHNEIGLLFDGSGVVAQGVHVIRRLRPRLLRLLTGAGEHQKQLVDAGYHLISTIVCSTGDADRG